LDEIRSEAIRRSCKVDDANKWVLKSIGKRSIDRPRKRRYDRIKPGDNKATEERVGQGPRKKIKEEE